MKKYNPMTDFLCYTRATYGDVNTYCYNDLHHPDMVNGKISCCSCHEDRLLTGKSSTGCTPSEQTIHDRRK